MKIVLVHKFIFYLPAIIWTGIIFWLSTGNISVNTPIEWLSIDKIGHLTFYMLEVIFMIWALAKSNKWTKSNHKQIIICILVAIIYGTSLEYVQAILPYRSFDYADMLANMVGAITGSLLYYKTATNFFLSK